MELYIQIDLMKYLQSIVTQIIRVSDLQIALNSEMGVMSFWLNTSSYKLDM